MDPQGQQASATSSAAPDASNTSLVFNSRFQSGGLLPDIALLAADGVAFYVHHQRLLAESANAFGGLLMQSTLPLTVPETASVLNIVLHVIYGMSCLRFRPPFESADAALAALIKYGVPLHLLAASQPLYELLMSYAPYHPIDVYALAGHFSLENIAVAVSAHLLAYDLSTLTDELSVKMGPTYLTRLFKLLQERKAALKDIVLRPPAAHPLTPGCSPEKQQAISRAWAFASMEIMWNALPNMSTGALESAFAQEGASIHCPDCKTMFRNRIAEVVAEWAAVKNHLTIHYNKVGPATRALAAA